MAILQERLRSASSPEPPVQGDAIGVESPAVRSEGPEVLPEKQDPEVAGHQPSQQTDSYRSAADEDLPARANNTPLTTGAGERRIFLTPSVNMSPSEFLSGNKVGGLHGVSVE